MTDGVVRNGQVHDLKRKIRALRRHLHDANNWQAWAFGVCLCGAQRMKSDGACYFKKCFAATKVEAALESAARSKHWRYGFRMKQLAGLPERGNWPPFSAYTRYIWSTFSAPSSERAEFACRSDLATADFTEHLAEIVKQVRRIWHGRSLDGMAGTVRHTDTRLTCSNSRPDCPELNPMEMLAYLAFAISVFDQRSSAGLRSMELHCKRHRNVNHYRTWAKTGYRWYKRFCAQPLKENCWPHAAVCSAEDNQMLLPDLPPI